MPTPNKYHGSGRLYTAKEYRDRKHAMRPTYLMQNRVNGVLQPRDKGNNERKRLARKLGYKSLKQWARSCD